MTDISAFMSMEIHAQAIQSYEAHSSVLPRATATEVEEELLEEADERIDTPWRVILYNDHIHTFDEVIFQLIKATGCSAEQATKYAFTAHVEGKVCVFEGEFEECFRVQGILREIQLVTEIEG